MRRGLGEREDALTQAAPLLVDPDHLQPTKVAHHIDFLGRITLDVWQALGIVALAVLLDLSRDLVGPAAQGPDFILGQETAYNHVAIGARARATASGCGEVWASGKMRSPRRPHFSLILTISSPLKSRITLIFLVG